MNHPGMSPSLWKASRDRISRSRGVAAGSSTVAALYVHVPFCHSQCTYCDFYRVGYRRDLARRFLAALEVELDTLRGIVEPRTLYVGGGTPSALGNEEFARLLEVLAPFTPSAIEYTVEVNPRSVTPEKVEGMRRAGVSRVSFGVQTFSERGLRLLGRRHAAPDVGRTFQMLRAHIRSISCDLIFGWPGQRLDDWQRDLEACVALGPDHLSVYSLIYEPGTPITQAVERRELFPLDEELERLFAERAVEFLRREGFERYEISSFARPGHRALHNLAYWRREDYAGAGPAATSTLGAIRIRNLPDVESYCDALLEGREPPREAEYLTRREVFNEYVFLGLRTSAGIAIEPLRRRGFEREVAGLLARAGTYRELGLLADEDGRLRLTDEGFFVADTVAAGLLCAAGD